MSDDEPQPGTEGYWQELAEQHDNDPDDFEEAVEDLRDDPSTDLDAERRQDEGWFKVYVECPDCHAPLARVTTESKHDHAGDGALDRSRTRIVGVCPDCGEFKAEMQVAKLAGDLEDIPAPDDEAWRWGDE